MEFSERYISPDWPAVNVKSLITTRISGESLGEYSGFNLATHVGEDRKLTEQNRERLYSDIGARVAWMEQVHGTDIVTLSGGEKGASLKAGLDADGVYSSSRGCVCAVLTADCLPVLLCNKEGTEVAALHAGWRGLANGVIVEGVGHFSSPPDQLLAYLGPAISQDNFEVGKEVYDAFEAQRVNGRFSYGVDHAFKLSPCNSGSNSGGKYLADLYALAQSELISLGVTCIYGGSYCTFEDSSRFYSYRRDGQTGRMASLIWIP